MADWTRITQKHYFQRARIALLGGLGPVMSRTTDENSETEEKKQLRILVIGKTGNGKSSIANRILRRKAFAVGCTMASTTLELQSAQSDDCVVTVVDTPDPVNANLADAKLKEEIQKWKKMTAPYPSAILLAVRCDVRYTAEEYAIYRKIKSAWADKSFVKRLIIVFTFKDRQGNDLDEELKTVCPELKNVLKDSGHTYVSFNNLDSKDMAEQQIKELFSKIDKIDKSSGARESSPLKIAGCLSALLFGITVFSQMKPPHGLRKILIAVLVFATPPALVAMYQRYKGL